MYQYFSRIYAEFCFSKKKTCSIFVFGGWLSTGERGRHYLEAHFGASDIQSTLGSSSSEERKEEDMRKQIEDRTRWLNALARKSALMDGEIWGDGEMGRWGDGDGWRIWWKTIVFQKLEPAKNHCPVKLFEFERGKWLPWAEVCLWNWTAFNCTAKMVAAAAVSPRASEGFVLKYYESRWLSRSDVLLNPKEFH